MVYKRKQRSYRPRVFKRTGRRLKTDTMIPGGRVNIAGIDPTPYFKGFQTAARQAQRVKTRSAQRQRRKRSKEETGSYQQFTNESHAFGRILRTNMKNKLLLRAAKENYIFSAKGMKAFDDNGAYYCCNANNPGLSLRQLPVYALLLNGRNVPGGATCQPFRMLWSSTAGLSDGQLRWDNINFLEPTVGTLTRNELVTEYRPERGTYNQVGEKLYWDWSEIKLNLWGARNKSIKWVIQIVKVLDDKCSPWAMSSGAYMDIEAQQVYEELIKQFTFNPLAKLNYEKSKRIKVLKTYERIIQPTSSTENDADPHCHVLKWFSRWNRVVNYDRVVDASNASGVHYRTPDDAEYVTAANRTQEGQGPYSVYPREREQVFLLIRASDYVDKTNDQVNNGVSGSFDFSMRSKFSVLD